MFGILKRVETGLKRGWVPPGFKNVSRIERRSDLDQFKSSPMTK